MGLVKDAVGGLLGSGADAAKKAAGRQIEGLQKADKRIRLAGEEAVGGLDPFTQVGQTDLQGLGALVTDPNAQKDFITNNPFFDALAGEATTRLEKLQSSKGKLDSGDTRIDLQNKLLLLGSDLLNQNITQRQNLAGLGFNSAQQQGAFGLNAAGTRANIATGIGETGAAGVLGARQAQSDALNQVVSLATMGMTGGFGGGAPATSTLSSGETIRRVNPINL
jgi:hypothetical protein